MSASTTAPSSAPSQPHSTLPPATLFAWTAVTDAVPPYDESRKVLCFTEGYDYAGTSFITLKASDFHEVQPDNEQVGTDEARTVSHWMWEDDAVASTRAAHPQKAAAPVYAYDAHELRRTICAVGVVGQIDGHDVIRRESVIDLIGRRN